MLVLPWLPGYGFSCEPQRTGWGPDRIARVWAEMKGPLGYRYYASQGSHSGSVVSDVMARQTHHGLLGNHVSTPSRVPPEVAKAPNYGDSAPSGLSNPETAAFAQLAAFYRKCSGYFVMIVPRPQTLWYGLACSPAGQAAWSYDKFATWTQSGAEPERAAPPDDMLDEISLCWFADTANSSGQPHCRNDTKDLNVAGVSILVAITVLPSEIYRAAQRLAERSCDKRIYRHGAEQGRHFAPWE